MNPHFNSQVQNMVKDTAVLKSHIMRLIQINSVTNNIYAQKRGRLHSKALASIPTGNVKVFKRKTVPQLQKDCAAIVLGDASGSTHGTKFYAETASFILLNEVFRTVGIPFEFLMFTENFSTRRARHMVLKSFGSKISEDQILARCNHVHENELGNNADGEALLWAYKRLSKRKEKRKILIMLSDGQPCCERPGDAANYLRKVAAQVETKVDLFSIGLCTESPKNFYKHWAKAQPDNLGAMFLELAKQKLLPNL